MILVPYWLKKKGIVALGKSCSYSSFAFSCNITPVTANVLFLLLPKTWRHQPTSKCLDTNNWGLDNREHTVFGSTCTPTSTVHCRYLHCVSEAAAVSNGKFVLSCQVKSVPVWFGNISMHLPMLKIKALKRHHEGTMQTVQSATCPRRRYNYSRAGLC